MLIKKLTEDNVLGAIKLLNKVFPYEAKKKGSSPKDAFMASLFPKKYEDFWEMFDLEKIKYYLAFDGDKIIGTTGLYKRKRDREDCVWLGWYCILPEYRGKKLGKKLLEWTIVKAKKEGYKKLRIYTSLHPNEKTAQAVYKKFGFKRIRGWYGYKFSKKEKIIFIELIIK